jgi:hypothetical protein
MPSVIGRAEPSASAAFAVVGLGGRRRVPDGGSLAGREDGLGGGGARPVEELLATGLLVVGEHALQLGA